MGCRVLLITHYLIRKILMETVLDVHIKCVNIKKFIDPDVVKIHFLQEKKRFIKRYLCWFTHRELYVSHEIMVEKMIVSTSSCNNVYKVVDENI